MPLEQATDIVERGILHLTPPFWGKPRFGSIVYSWLSEVQELEDAAFDVINKRLLENATHKQLDTLGKIVGIRRGSAGDDLYRGLIRIKIQVNLSQGQAQDVYDMFSAFSSLVYGHTDFVYTEPGPMTIVVRFQDTFPVDSPQLTRLAKAVRPGATSMHVVRPLTNSPSNGNTMFRFRDASAASTAAKGYGSAGGTLRGYYADVTVY